MDPVMVKKKNLIKSQKFEEKNKAERTEHVGLGVILIRQPFI